MRLTRGQRIVRNLLLSALLGVLLYVLLWFPPYTVRGMLDRVERRYLLSDLEPVLVERKYLHHRNEWLSDHFTYLIARSGETYVATEYSRHGLEVQSEGRRFLKMSREALCMGLDGTLYVAGEFADAAFASVEVTAERTTRMYDPNTEEYELVIGERKTFTYQGEKVSDALFAFRLREGTGWDSGGLEEVSSEWYSGYVIGDTSGVRRILHRDLPVRVMLYGEDGGILDTLELAIDNYELHRSW